jgi:hypothetical protein
MQKSRRRKIWLSIFGVVLLLGIAGYIFRYPLILRFQYYQLQSLKCANGNCLQRIWVHRVNSIERYEIVKDKFEGFESDIVYNAAAHSFSVYHPPVPAEGDTLSLQQLFNHADLRQKHFWLDTRSVDSSNVKQALEAVGKLADSASVRSNCIFELYNINAARFFAENGYTVSFNVPESLLKESVTNHTLKDSLASLLGKVKYVSQDIVYLNMLKRLFPGKPIITWDPRFSDFFNKSKIQWLLDDPQVAIILVNIKSRYYR